jgi:phage-related minor tail protein
MTKSNDYVDLKSISPRDKAAEEQFMPGSSQRELLMECFKIGWDKGADWQAQQEDDENKRLNGLREEAWTAWKNCNAERDQLKRELNDAKILLEAARNESVQERVIAELKAERDRYREIAEKMAGALSKLKDTNFNAMEGAGEPEFSNYDHMFGIAHYALADYVDAMKEEMGRD